MPQMLFSLSDEDYADFKGPHRSEKLRQLLKEKREHKCPEPTTTYLRDGPKGRERFVGMKGKKEVWEPYAPPASK